MKKLFYILSLAFIVSPLAAPNALAQLITKDVVNRGTIIIKKKTLQQKGGKIDNKNGHIILDGPTASFTQDTLLGRIDFVLDLPKYQSQYVPAITYWDVRFSGGSRKKIVDTTKNLVSLFRFVSDTSAWLEYNPNKSFLDLRGRVTHNGGINWGVAFGLAKLDGEAPQQVDGKGLFKEFGLDNSRGADVVNKGGFRINTTLDLIRGELRNSDTANFVMLDNSKIIRHVGASLKSEPIFDGSVSVQYVGDGKIISGPEIPNDPKVLADLIVENSGGLTLSKNATVNRELIVQSSIETEPDSNNRRVLTKTSESDPVYGTANSEIRGSFRRTKIIADGRKIKFNNDYTYALFADASATGGISEMTFRVRPKQFPPNSDPSSKVIRNLYISAKDAAGNPIMAGLNAVIGYGWRNSPDSSLDETNGLTVSDVKLQRWENSNWSNIESSLPPQIDATRGWAYSSASGVTRLGQFAMGIDQAKKLFFYAKAILEGPYRYGSMANDLRMKNLVPKTPPDIYPYNLDPFRETTVADSLPENVVDWVLLEFRKDSLDNPHPYYRNCLLLQDGRIVDVDGHSPVSAAKADMEKGDYYVAIRHRNHLAVVSKNAVDIYPGAAADYLNFSDPKNVVGGASALKPVGFNPDNSILFALIAGDVDGDGKITDYDLQYSKGEALKIWDERDREGYYLFDANMNGIINTRDLNVAWNNRGRISFAP